MKYLTFFFLIVFSILLMTADSYGATKTWNKTNGGTWSTSSNWSPSGAPAAGDSVIINSDQSSNIISVPTISLLALIINGNCDLEASTSGNTITVTGTLSVASGKTISIGGTTRTNFTLDANAVGTINGIFTQNAGSTTRTFTCSGNLSIGPSGYINGAGAFVLSSGATLQIGSTNGITSGTTASGNIQVTGNRTYNAAANYIYNGTSNQNTGNGLPTNLTGSLTINNPGYTVTLSNAKTIANGGTVNLNSGTFAAGTNLTMSSTTTINRSEGSMTGTLQGTGIYDVNYTGNSKTSGPELSGSGLRNMNINLNSVQILTIDQNRTPDGNLTISSGTLDINTYTINRSASGGTFSMAAGTTLLVGGASNFPSNYSTRTLDAASTVNYDNNGNQTVAQVTYGNLTLSGSGTKTLTGSTTVNGALTINSGATFSVGSNYALTLGGDFTNNGTFTAGMGTVTLSNASSEQNIGGTAVTTFYNLTMNNTSAGGVTLGNNEIVSNTLTLTGGKIFTGTNTLTLGTGTSALGTLSPATPSQSSYIVGNFERWFGASVMTDMSWFPVGTATSFRPAGIIFTAAPTSGGKILVTGYNTNPGSVNTTFPVDSSYTVNRYSKEAWWQITPTTLTGGTYSVSLGAFNITGVNDYTKLRVLKRATSSDLWTLAGTYSLGSGSNLQPYANRKGLTGFSQFGIGGNSADNPLNTDAPLPVMLSSFISNVAGRNVILKWMTGTEINNSGFDIERKGFSGEFVKVGFVQGKGTVSTPSSYEFTDRNLISGKYSYRLKQIDNNGNFEYYSLNGDVVVGVPSKFDLSQNYPNPFNPSTKINFDMPKDGLVSLKIYDMLGREVTTLVNEIRTAGYYTVDFNASSLSSGIYFYRINAGDFSSVKNMVIVK